VGKAVFHGEGSRLYPFFVLYSPLQGEYTCLVVDTFPVFNEAQMKSFPPSMQLRKFPPSSLVSPLVGSAGPSKLTSTFPGKIALEEVPL
jgi:hypothetical protein